MYNSILVLEEVLNNFPGCFESLCLCISLIQASPWIVSSSWPSFFVLISSRLLFIYAPNQLSPSHFGVGEHLLLRGAGSALATHPPNSSNFIVFLDSSMLRLEAWLSRWRTQDLSDVGSQGPCTRGPAEFGSSSDWFHHPSHQLALLFPINFACVQEAIWPSCPGERVFCTLGLPVVSAFSMSD